MGMKRGRHLLYRFGPTGSKKKKETFKTWAAFEFMRYPCCREQASVHGCGVAFLFLQHLA
jgi:hypothetical protein